MQPVVSLDGVVSDFTVRESMLNPIRDISASLDRPAFSRFAGRAATRLPSCVCLEMSAGHAIALAGPIAVPACTLIEFPDDSPNFRAVSSNRRQGFDFRLFGILRFDFR
jgi:hypothetical protein